jgi:5,5'-dehydrodivanillate O-demethylase oxygenase subunit
MHAARDQTTDEHAVADYTDFAHTGPGTLAGRYLRQFWQPVYVAAELPPGHARPLRIMSEDYTLYRGEDGTPHVVAPRCAHRGTQLSTGWVEGDCIRCFYHGWKYDGSGQCVEMPAEDPSFPPKVRIESYPTEEYLGLVFAYLSRDTTSGAVPPLPRYPELEADGVLDVWSYIRRCNYFSNLENGVDPVHLGFTHRASSIARSGLIGVPSVSAEEREWGFNVYAQRPGDRVRVTVGVMPNISYRKGTPSDAESGWQDVIAWRVPLDDTQHYSFNVNLVHVTGEAAERYRQRLQARRADAGARAEDLIEAVLRGDRCMRDLGDEPSLVNVQDSVVQLGQGAIPDPAHERLGRSDAGIIVLRKLWARELRALAEGRPLTRWTAPREAVTSRGV